MVNFFKADLALRKLFTLNWKKVTFQEDLGSVRAKVERIGRIAEQITDQLH